MTINGWSSINYWYHNKQWDIGDYIMATLKVNTISKSSGNNVSMQDPLNLKSYTTTQRDALTSAAGDMIYNTTDSKVQFYNGSSWNDL